MPSRADRFERNEIRCLKLANGSDDKMQPITNAIQEALGKEPSIVHTDAAKGGAKVQEGRSMQALTWQGTQKVQLKEVPVPDINQDKDIILRVTGTTICGSDLHLYNAEILSLQPNDILGHEFMGVVEKVGPGVKKLKPGKRVVVSFQVACGECRYCQKKLSSFCDRTNDSSLMQYMYGARDAGFFGYSHFTGGFAGGQAEYVRVPIGDVNCLEIPDDVPDEQALYLSDVLPTSYHCVVDTGVTEGDVVCVWGLGPIGIAVCQWARVKGAKRVIGIDQVSSRLMHARKLDFETIDFSKHKSLSEHIIKEVCPEGVDKCLDCTTFHEPKSWLQTIEKKLMLATDTIDQVNEMIVTVRKGGSIGLIAVYAGFANHFNIGAVMEKGIRFIGNGQAPVHLYWETILNDYLRTGKFSCETLVSHRCPIEDFVPLYDAFQRRLPGVEKVFVETSASQPPSKGFPQSTRVKDWSTELSSAA